MPKQEKVAVVRQLRERVGGASALYFVDFTGVGANDFADFRRRLRGNRVEVRVVKNRLALRAMVECGVPSDVAEVLRGPTTIVFAGEDPVAPARLLKEALGRLRGLKVKGVYLEHNLYRSDQFEMIAALPTKEELRAHLVGILESPVCGLVLVLENLVAELVRVIDELARRQSPGSV